MCHRLCRIGGGNLWGAACLEFTPATHLSWAMALSQEPHKEMAGTKAMQSNMGEEIQRIKEVLGQVSCHHQHVAGLRQQPVTSLCAGGSAASGHAR